MATDHNSAALLTFRVGPFHLAAPAVEVDAIITMPAYRSVPLAPPAVVGVFTHRDKIACIVSLHCKFGLPEPDDRSRGQLIITHLAAGLIAFRVDEVLDMTSMTDIDGCSLAAIGPQTPFDRFTYKDDRIYLYTNFEILYALDENDFASLGVAPPPEPVVPVAEPRQTVAASEPAPVNRQALKDENTPGHTSAMAANDGPARSAVVSAPAPQQTRRPTQDNPQAGRQRRRISSPQRPPGLPSPHGRQPSRRPRTFRATLYPAVAGPSPDRSKNRDHPPSPSSPHTTVLVTLLLMAVILAGLWAYFSYFPTTPPKTTDIWATPAPVAATATPKNKMTPAPSHAQVPFPEVSNNSALTAGSSKPPQAVAATQPDDTVVTHPPKPEPLNRPSSNPAVWQVETDDFIITVERPPKPHAVPAAISPSPAPRETVHVVVAGDTLWHIAERYLGNPFRYPELAALSRIENPDLIFPGDIVRIRKKSSASEGP